VTDANPLTPAMFAVLLTLTQGERHGYALMTDVARLTGGAITLGAGTLYRTLQRLRVDRLVIEIEVNEAAVRADRRAERRRLYMITEAGRAAARAEAHRLAAMLDSDAARALLAEPRDG
jgi:DNA-binding PadR family transcriptional regulator